MWDINVKVPVNGRVRKGTIKALCEGEEKFTDKANLEEAKERRRVARDLSRIIEESSVSELEKQLMEAWIAEERKNQQEQARQQEQTKQQTTEQTGSGPAGDCPWREVKLPAGYSIASSGYVLDQGGDGTHILTRGPVWVEALARDNHFDGWGHLLVWRDRDGHMHRQAFPAGRFHEQGLSIVQELAGGGLAVVPGQERAMLRYLAAFEPTRRVRSVNRLGWVDVPGVPVPVYVFTGSVVGDVGEEQFVYQPDVSSTLASAPQVAGTLEDWKGKVASRTKKNPVLLFGLCASFAGPLLKWSGMEGGGFHLHGGSSKGKTTWAQLAASVWGCGADPAEAPSTAFIRKWNTTANAVEAIAADHNDNILVLDEIGEAQSQDLGRLIYQLAGGQGKSRLKRDTALRAPRTWRVLVLSTGEVPVQAVVEATGRRARGGQLVRMVDVPATGTDDGIVRDIIHESHNLPPAEFVHALKRACATFFGTAGPAFVRSLCAEGDTGTLSRRVQSEVAEAHKRLVPPDAAEEVSRVVRRFALVLVAGQLACAAGILPFTPADIETAVRLVFHRWRAVHGRGPMERAAEQLRAFLLRNESRFRNRTSSVQDIRDLAGYWDPEAKLYLLTPEGAQEALDGYSVRDVMQYLAGKGLLCCNEEQRLMSKFRINGIDRQVRVYAVRTALLGDAATSSEKESDCCSEPCCF